MSDVEPPVTRTGPQPLQIRQGLTAGSIVAAFLTIIIGVRAGFGIAEYLGSALCSETVRTINRCCPRSMPLSF
jgi:hypothetical protein